MRWEIQGADRSTGRDTSLVIDAESEDSARRRANRAGIVVSAIRPLDPDDSVAGVAMPPPTPPHAAPQPYAAPVPVYAAYTPPPPKGVSGLGVAAIVIGAVALLISWIPFISAFALVFAFVGVVAAGGGLLIALIGGRSGVGAPIAGLLINLLAGVVAFAMTWVVVNSGGS